MCYIYVYVCIEMENKSTRSCVRPMSQYKGENKVSICGSSRKKRKIATIIISGFVVCSVTSNNKLRLDFIFLLKPIT